MCSGVGSFGSGGESDVSLLAIAGGAGPAGEEVLSCCAVCPILPLVLMLSGLALFRNSIWPAVLAFILAGSLGAISLLIVAGYKPTTDSDVVVEQAAGVKAVEAYGLLAVPPALSAVWIIVSRLL